MLDNIKAIYFIRFYFSFINEKRKLGLIKYNKKLKSWLDINLLNYKLFSGRYIIYEENNKGKEYDYKGNLIYEGEFKNGERNGKGLEYNMNKNLIFKGEYLKGKRWNGNGFYSINFMYELKNGNGFVKEIIYKITKVENLIEDDLVFEGNYLNGEKNGEGKEYTKQGDLIFKGKYLNGKKWNGIMCFKNNENFEIKNGKGLIKEYLSNAIFSGEYLYGERYGKGKEYYIKSNKLKFEGEYLNGKRNGKGKEYNKNDELVFEGEYYFNFKLKGKLFTDDNEIHELINDNEKIKEFVNYYYLKSEFEYINDTKNGKGKEYYYDGKIKFEGIYVDGNQWKGIEKTFHINGLLKSEIDFVNGKIEKQKDYNDKGELVFEGKYFDGKRWNGKGKEYNYLGHLEFEGKYINGKKYHSKNSIKYLI